MGYLLSIVLPINCLASCLVLRIVLHVLHVCSLESRPIPAETQEGAISESSVSFPFSHTLILTWPLSLPTDFTSLF